MPRRNRRRPRASDAPITPPEVGPDRRDAWTRACRDKVAYGNEAAAQLAAAELEERHGQHFNTYRCPRCGRWHTGRAPSGQERP